MLPVLPALQESVELAPGDWLLIFSDGIPEAADESGEDFGDNGLLDALGRLETGRPRKCARASWMKCEITSGNSGSRTTSL